MWKVHNKAYVSHYTLISIETITNLPYSYTPLIPGMRCSRPPSGSCWNKLLLHLYYSFLYTSLTKLILCLIGMNVEH
jgi:hypothetical protein